jgi:sigma-B regulation protein RsbU (phosphoserine phosphatase)
MQSASAQRLTSYGEARDFNPTLLLIQGTEQRTIPVQRFPFTIGRRSDKDLTLPDVRVSRDHAHIEKDNACFYLVDEGSKHGTFINGARIIRQQLVPNDRVVFGTDATTVIFSPEQAPSSTAREFLSQIIATPVISAGSDLEKLTLFLEAARKLNTTGLLNDVLVTLIETTLRITQAERGFVFLRGLDGSLRLAAGQDAKGKLLKDDQTISRSLLEEAVSSDSEFLVQDVRQLTRLAARQSIVANELRSIICIPLRRMQVRDICAEEVTVSTAPAIAGVLYLDSRFAATDLSRTGHDILRAIATEAAALLENAHLAQAEEASRKVQQELAIAASIQQRLMAVSIPDVSYLNIRAKNVPCRDIGGDFYDVVMTPQGVGLVVADVCGKGISAALLASILQGMLYSQLQNSVPLVEAVTVVNRFLCAKDLGAKYATLVLLLVGRDGEAELVNCGHIPPLVISRNGAHRTPACNVPVGLLADATYESTRLQLLPGDRVVVVTDGLTEAENPAGDFFGDENLEAAAAEENPFEYLFTRVHEFCHGRSLSDDCTVVDLLYCGSAEPQ